MAAVKKHNTSERYNITPVLDTNAYTAGDVLGGAMTLNAGPGLLKHLRIVDANAQAAGMVIYIFRVDPDIADDAAMSPTDAELLDCVGHFEINVWKTLTGGVNSLAFVTIDIELVDPGAYIVYVETRGTPTHTVSGLEFEFTHWPNKAG